MPTLGELLKTGDLARVRDYLDTEALPSVIDAVNRRFCARNLLKLPRAIERLPIRRPELSSYRTRLGTMLEYAMCTALDNWLDHASTDGYHLCFVTFHEYPDFVLRDRKQSVVARLEMKSIDRESEEQAARFDAPTPEIQKHQDLLLVILWEWQTDHVDEVEVEHPVIIDHLLVLAHEIAAERDARVREIGGEVRADGSVWVPSHKHPGTMVKDPGNYGKFHRIVHSTRRDRSDLSESAKLLVELVARINAGAPRSERTRRARELASGGAATANRKTHRGS